MALKDELEDEVKKIFRFQWESRDGEQIPAPENLKLGNSGVNLEAAVLYADLAESTNLVETKSVSFAAEIYKSYLHCASKIIRGQGGEITAFDGDRVMGVFIGNTKRTSAALCALKINYAVQLIVNPAIKSQYPNENYSIKHAVGVDIGKLFVARTGIRGANDLVWVGRAANYAAKLCSLRDESYASWITEDVYNGMNDEAKIYDGKNMWEARTWTAKNITVYRSSWRWVI